MERDPARVAAHDLHHHDPVVALGRGVEAVDRLGGDVHRGVEAEGQSVAARSLSMVFGTPTTRGRARRAGGGRPQRVLAADGDQAVQVSPLQVGLAVRSGPSLALEGLRDEPRIVPPRGGSRAWTPEALYGYDAMSGPRCQPSRRPIEGVSVGAALADDGADGHGGRGSPDRRVSTRDALIGN